MNEMKGVSVRLQSQAVNDIAVFDDVTKQACCFGDNLRMKKHDNHSNESVRQGIPSTMNVDAIKQYAWC